MVLRNIEHKTGTSGPSPKSLKLSTQKALAVQPPKLALIGEIHLNSRERCPGGA